MLDTYIVVILPLQRMQVEQTIRLVHARDQRPRQITVYHIMSVTQTTFETNPTLVPQDGESLTTMVEKLHTKPLWKQMNRLNPPLPNPTAVPHIWRYDEIRPSLIRAGELVNESQAERRVLMLVNPARGEYLSELNSACCLLLHRCAIHD